MQSNVKRLLELAFNTAAAVIIVVDGVARPLYRPILQWASSVDLIRRAEVQVAALPRPAILALFAVPFAIAEPAKVLALVWLAEGSLFSGLLLLAVSYLATFLVVERIYQAGKPKLLTYVWFAWCIDQLSVVRNRLNDAKARIRGLVARFVG
jgi:hypothetical protein